jgi:hypothetical protein
LISPIAVATEMTPIGICSKNEKCLPVLLKSIELYVPEDVEIFITSPNIQSLPRHKVHHFVHTYETCGAAHNFIAHKIFETHDDFISIDDDAVLNPNTYGVLMEDVNLLKSMGFKIGCVAGRTNYAKGFQNIRRGEGNLSSLGYESENQIIETDYLAGIVSWCQKSTWIELPPIDWFADDLVCNDLIKNGCKLFVSRAYFHHVGSQTFGTDFAKCKQNSEVWLRENRPDMHKKYFGTQK